jgi:hypothetical protein
MQNSLRISLLIGNEYNQNKSHFMEKEAVNGHREEGSRSQEAVFTKPLKEDE